ncbi:putative ripening-related protein 2 [Capsicum baccatum]|uniref:Ripening-related protein 2 n=1 Tax=Capsicum baccatum TaxID=33114 RepID=A0A2G2XMI7_CAPBA|nr:putative ripening-related protein 2 [Capsicum baccatum]
MNKGTNTLNLVHFAALLIVVLLACSNTLMVQAETYKPNGRMKAKLTLNDFQKGGSGGGPSECSGKYYDNSIPVVALSSRWYSKGRRCFENINIYAKNGRSTQAMVVDECDTSRACKNNIVDASEAVWKALGVSKKDPRYVTVMMVATGSGGGSDVKLVDVSSLELVVSLVVIDELVSSWDWPIVVDDGGGGAAGIGIDGGDSG